METRLRIESVKAGGNAEAIGLKPGDILESLNGIALYSGIDLDKAIGSVQTSAMMIVDRDSEKLSFDVESGPLGIMVVEVNHDPNLAIRLRDMLITTTPTLEGYRVVKTIDIVSAECVFGMNIFKDFFMALTDFFGGRSGTAQQILRSARVKCLQELRMEALNIGANAVIGIDLDYSEISGSNTNMLFLVATGTAVVVEKI